MLCVRGGWFMVIMSGGCQVRSAAGEENSKQLFQPRLGLGLDPGSTQLTLILALHTPLQPIRRPTKAVLVHLGVDKLENRDEPVLSTRVLRCQLLRSS
jgi:hypothetical protein